MEVKEAVKAALEYVEEVFVHTDLSNVGLEEVVYDDRKAQWKVTVGFSRPWDYYHQPGALSAIKGRPPIGRMYKRFDRTYKVVEIRDSDGKATAIKMREVGGDE